jgi:hypothetical protein
MDAIATSPAIRHDGWTPERKTQFLYEVAACGNIRSACSHVGLSPEAAYRLRRRDALFARAWAAALVLAREVSAEVLECRAIEGIEEAVWYRGEVVGTRRRYDNRLLLAHMARLDAQAETGTAHDDAARFDELLACVGGIAPPAELSADGDGFPLTREACIEAAGEEAEWNSRWDDDEDEPRDDDQSNREEREADEIARYRQARDAAGKRWDAWTRTAYAGLDRLLDADPFDEPFPESVYDFRTLSTSSTSSAAARRTGGVVASQRNG